MKPVLRPLFLGLVALAVALGSAPASAQLDLSESFSFGGFPDPPGESPTAQVAEPVTVNAEVVAAQPGRPPLLAITASIAPGYHIYSLTQAAGGPGKSVIKLDDSSGYRVAGPFRPTAAPESHIDNEIWDGLTIEEHTGTVTWYAPLELAPGADAASIVATGTIEVQACQANRCEVVRPSFTARLGSGESVRGFQVAATAPPAGQAIVEQATDPATVVAPLSGVPAPASDAAAGAGSLLPLLGAALLGGLILNLMPCVLPVIGLKVLSFAEQGGQSRGRVLGLNLAYSAGLIGVFLVLALLASLAQLGLASSSYGWGELYTLAWFKISMVVLVFAMALSFLGVWEIPIPGFAGAGKANDLQQKEGYSGAFFKGIFTTILATPCSGPFLGPVFAYTLLQPPAVTFLLFAFVGIGMASPYLLIGLLPGLVRSLPKPGAWMETFKQLMGFVLMGTVVYLLSTVSQPQRLPVLTLLVAVGFACWWIGRTPITAPAGARRTAWLGGWATAAAIGWFAFWAFAPGGHELPWKPYTPASLAAAQSSGKTVLIDFTADWCPTCKLNLKRAINTTRVKEVVEANGVEPLLADWTDMSEAIKQKLAELGSRSIPLLAIYPAGQPQPIILRDLITRDQLLTALREAGATEANISGGDPGGAVVMPEIEIGEAVGQAAYR